MLKTILTLVIAPIFVGVVVGVVLEVLRYLGRRWLDDKGDDDK